MGELLQDYHYLYDTLLRPHGRYYWIRTYKKGTAMSSEGNILLADDEPVFLEATTLRLQKKGYNCHGVRTSEAALAILDQDTVDLMILDINIPGNENLDLLHAVKQKDTYLPVIVITGSPSVSSVIESFHNSIVEFLIKPFEFEDLTQSIMQALQEGRSAKALRQADHDMDEWVRGLNERRNTNQGLSLTHHAHQPRLDTFIEQSVHQIGQMVMGLQSTLEIAKTGYQGSGEDLCAVLRCPKKESAGPLLRQSLLETIDVLQETKADFKSKKLAELRMKLKAVLKQLPPP